MPAGVLSPVALTWFASDERLEEALHFLDGKLGLVRHAPESQSFALEEQATERRAFVTQQPEIPDLLAHVSSALQEILNRVVATERELEEIRAAPKGIGPAGSVERPIGVIRNFLEDAKARGFKARGIVDVGANIGTWTRMALSVFGDIPFLVIEPQDEMVLPLTALIEKRPGCHFIKAGAGREPGKLVQTIWEDLGGSSFLPPIDDALRKEGRQRLTKIVTIDDVLRKYPTFYPDLVKLDIQGFELEALAGGETLFGRTELFIVETSLFEFMPRQPVLRDVIAFMADRGYEVYDVTEFGRRPFDGALGQMDAAFVKRNGMFRRTNAW